MHIPKLKKRRFVNAMVLGGLFDQHDFRTKQPGSTQAW